MSKAGDLVLVVVCGDLAVGIDANRVERVLSVDEITYGRGAMGATVKFGGDDLLAWSLSEILALSSAAVPRAWVMLNTGRGDQRIAIGVDRCLAVVARPRDRQIPHHLLSATHSADHRAFSAHGIEELAGYPGVLVPDLAAILPASALMGHAAVPGKGN